MRPIKLKIKGLNSFVEEQTIDFEKLTKQGFFGIFGPTGSGKSTILDGMILALYGMKAMSRGTNEFVNKNCKSAQVSYEFQISGREIRRYRVEREFKANEKGTKSGKCKLLDITDGEIVLEETVSGVDKACAEIIGLTADDFMRTVVLPQGKFSEFLKVSGRERREILERLFRLEEYGVKLEERIAFALKKETAEHTKLSGQAEAYGEYSEELLKEKELRKVELEENLAQTELHLKEKREELDEVEAVWRLQKEEADKTQELLALREKQSDIEELRKNVLMAERAGQVMPILMSVKELETKEKTLEKQLQKVQMEYSDWKEKLDRCKEEFENAEQKKEAEEGNLIVDISYAKEALEYWKELPELLRREKRKEQEKEAAFLNQKALFHQENELAEEKQNQEKQLQQLETDILSKEISSEYREKVEDLMLRLNGIHTLEDELKNKGEECTGKRTQITTYEKQIAKEQEKEAEQEKQVKELQEKLEYLNKSAEQIHILQLQKKLHEGEPCPVCGSVHFEIRQSDIVQDSSDEMKLLEQIESLKEAISKVQEKLQKTQNEKQVNVQLLELAVSEMIQQEKRKQELAKVFQVQCAAFSRELEQHEIKDITTEKKKLRQMDLEREKLDKQIRLKKQKLSEQEQNLKAIQEKQVAQRELVSNLELELTLLRTEIAHKKAEIEKKIGGETEPEVYLKKLQEKLSVLQSAYKNAKAYKEQAEVHLKQSEEQWNHLSGEQKGNRAALEQAENHLQSEMEKQDFSTREAVEQVVLRDKVLQDYKKEIEHYTEQLREAEVKLAEVQKKRGQRSTTEDIYQSSKAEVSRLESVFTEQKEHFVEIRQEIRRIHENLEKQSELMAKIKVLEHKIAVLEDLKSVTKGKRFVEFMATERLKYISKSASKRLYAITNGNYELEINAEGEFIIRDNKNGGVLRQTATLSGGETFVTSLALALALSSEIQLKGTAPLELFFLDEGFGSLDETLLDVVMESLERIHNEQLKVGIISHVESVKMRVPVRLIVSPAETGVSGSKVKMEYS